jgi:SAM-dependent methyltransferase
MKDRLRSLARTLAGTALEMTRPALVRELDLGENRGANLRAKTWILHARVRRARLLGDSAAAQAALARYWQADTGDFFYDRYRDRFAAWFHGPHQVLIDQLEAAALRLELRELVEIGCGDGQALAHCAARMPGLERLTGIDINPTIIARNMETHAGDARLRFVEGDAQNWLAAHPAPRRALLSYGGVMEYFAPEALRAIFAGLAAHGPAVVALCEPVAPDHDLATHPASRMFGQESSFSHNHAHLLRAEGFEIRWQAEATDGGVRWAMMIAERGKHAATT